MTKPSKKPSDKSKSPSDMQNCNNCTSSTDQPNTFKNKKNKGK